MGLKIGIVGGAGYIGSSLADHFSRMFNVKIIDVRPPKSVQVNASFELCDIRSYVQVKKALADVDLVIHTAIIQIPQINEQRRLGYEVNVIGTQNVCKVVDENPKIKGMILTGSWHVMGERGLEGVIDESFGFRPDKVEDRARVYALSKIAQETIVRLYDEISDKIYGIIRLGTVLGKGMPEKTAANIFIEKGLKEGIITPFRHAMYRPMLYVDINDVCRAFEAYVKNLISNKIKKTDNSLAHIVNVFYPEPITILELAEIVRDIIVKVTEGKIMPKIEVIDQGIPPLFSKDDKLKFTIDMSKNHQLLGIDEFIHPKETIESIIKNKWLRSNQN